MSIFLFVEASGFVVKMNTVLLELCNSLFQFSSERAPGLAVEETDLHSPGCVYTQGIRELQTFLVLTDSAIDETASSSGS